MSKGKITIEYVDHSLLARDGREVCVQILSNSHMVVTRLASPARRSEALIDAFTLLVEKTDSIHAERHEQLPDRENRKYLNGYMRAMRKIMGNTESERI